jgi:hypothetical protein
LENAEKSLDAKFLTDMLERIGWEVIHTAEPLTPFLTGDLRRSGYVEVDSQGTAGAKADFGFSMPYAAPVEFGGGGFRGPVEPRPFLRPAYEVVVGTGKAVQMIKEAIGKELEEVNG